MKVIESFRMNPNYRSYLHGLVLLLLTMGTQVSAEETRSVRLNQSAGYRTDLSAHEQEQLLERSALQENQLLVLFGSRTEAGSMPKHQMFHPTHNRSYRIYDAGSELSWDDDGDGFYHRLRVSFDADVDHGEAHVYAKLFLSFEGGPWNHYFTTDVFHIFGEAGYDDYVVVTRLLDDYPSGYYDVLIELYDADGDVHVADHGPYENTALSALPLEDQFNDNGNSSSESHGGGGGFHWLSLCLLALVLYPGNNYLDRVFGRLFVGHKQDRISACSCSQRILSDRGDRKDSHRLSKA